MLTILDGVLCLRVSEPLLNCVGSYAADVFVVQAGDPEVPPQGFFNPSGCQNWYSTASNIASWSKGSCIWSNT
jgi:hypothetical protein